MKAKTVQKAKGSVFLQNLKMEMIAIIDSYSASDQSSLKVAVIELAEDKCKKSFRNGVEVGMKTRQRKGKKR